LLLRAAPSPPSSVDIRRSSLPRPQRRRSARAAAAAAAAASPPAAGAEEDQPVRAGQRRAQGVLVPRRAREAAERVQPVVPPGAGGKRLIKNAYNCLLSFSQALELEIHT